MTVKDAPGYQYELPKAGAQEFFVIAELSGEFHIGEVSHRISDMNAKLKTAKSGWRLAIEPGTHTRVLPITVTYNLAADTQPDPDSTTPEDVLQSLATSEPIPLVPNAMLKGLPGHRTNIPTNGSTHLKVHALPRADSDRVPVAVLAENPPPRRALNQLTDGRRPIVALLDTQVEPHEWLGDPDTDIHSDGFWIDAGALGWDPGPRLHTSQPGSLSGTGSRAPLSDHLSRSPRGSQTLQEDEGHGTFCAGLVRQIAPDARVLAVHVIGDDGRVYGHHLLNALGWLKERESSGLLASGDVVCIPAGFQPVFPVDLPYLRLLAGVLADLADSGIRVVAAAGNDGSSEPAYPAAFAASTGVPEDVRMVSVGAYNTDGRTPAYFSNHGTWVTRWEIGTSVVSTFPKVNRAAAPEFVARLDPEDPAGFPDRTTADPDDFTRRKPSHRDYRPVWELDEEEVALTAGFTRWSGTSFAAAIHAGKLAQARVGRPLGAGTAPPV